MKHQIMNNTENKLAQLVKDVLKHLPWGEVTEHTPGEMARYLISNGVGFEKEPPRWRPASEPQTNADHIRDMTDEELARILGNKGCPPEGSCSTVNNCVECYRRWLQQPYKEERHE